METSTYKKRVEPRRLADGAPNILIILMDDVGPGTPSTYGGEINTPTLDRVAKMGVSFNRFHSTAMCSPTRASLLTGRNHTFVGNGQIAAIANDFDGFSGTIPKSSATVAEVLKNYGYNTGAWGKWHNTPEEQITSKGPFDYWPTGYGFEYFYGFLAGEASQYEPTLTRNTTPVTEHPKKGYHLTEDIAEDAIKWLREQKAYAPDKPFFMYWAPGASHGPHQVMKEWADKYKGKFDDGWDKYRERTFARAKAKGWIPQDAQLTPRPASMASWDSIPEAEKPFQRRLMEVFAGFTEHADYNAGQVIDEIEHQGKLDNTLIFYIWGDNGSSSEGLNGTISEQLAQNGIPTTIAQHIEALEELGGLRRARRPEDRQHVPRRLGLGGQHALPGHQADGRLLRRHPPADGRLLAEAHQGRSDAAAAVPPRDRHRADDLRADEDHRRRASSTASSRIRSHGVSMVYTLRRCQGDGHAQDAVLRHHGQPRHLPRRLVRQRPGPARAVGGRHAEGHQGMVAADRQVGALPHRRGLEPGERTWPPANPKKLEEMKALFIVESTKNKNLPIGGGLWSTAMFHPEDAPALAAHRMDLRLPHHPDAGVGGAQARQEQQPRDHGRGRAGQRQRRAVRAGRLLRRHHLLREGRLPELRVQPVRGAAHEDQVQGQAAAGQGEDRGRVEAGRQDRRADGHHAAG